MANAIVVQTRVQAEDIKAYNRVGKASVDVKNGDALVLGALSKGVFAVTKANAVAKGLWMAYAPEIVSTNGFKGLDKDVRNFSIKAGEPIDMFKPVVGDFITVTEDFFKTKPEASKKIIELDSTGAYVAVASATASYDGLGFNVVEETYIVVATGAIGADRVKAYTLEVTNN